MSASGLPWPLPDASLTRAQRGLVDPGPTDFDCAREALRTAYGSERGGLKLIAAWANRETGASNAIALGRGLRGLGEGLRRIGQGWTA